MSKVYEIKDKVLKFWAEYDTYLKIVYKFIIAMVLFCMINATVGFMDRINSLPIALLLALVCCILPQGVTLFVAAVLVLLHLYVLSMEVAIVAALIFAAIFLLYFRFAPHDGVLVAITPVFHALGIPYILPIGAGLLRKPYSISAVVCGSMVFYFLNGIYENVKALQSTAAGADAEAAKVTITTNQLLSNSEMYLAIGVFVVAFIVVQIVRRLTVDHAWKIAIVAGSLVQMAGLFAGYLMFDIQGKTVGMIIGNLVSLALGFVLEFLFFNLDYSRTERVQFEDDEYYYYVKAVPKKNVSTTDKNVTEFNGFPKFGKNKEEKENISRKEIAKELEIEEDLLK